MQNMMLKFVFSCALVFGLGIGAAGAQDNSGTAPVSGSAEMKAGLGDDPLETADPNTPASTSANSSVNAEEPATISPAVPAGSTDNPIVNPAFPRTLQESRTSAASEPQTENTPAPAPNPVPESVTEPSVSSSEPPLSDEEKRNKADFAAVQGSGRENMILGDIEPLRSLIQEADLTCNELDGGYFNVSKKTSGNRVNHTECGRLWCDEQMRSYRMYYQGEYSVDGKTSYVDSTRVEPWSKSPALCNAD